MEIKIESTIVLSSGNTIQVTQKHAAIGYHTEHWSSRARTLLGRQAWERLVQV